MARCDDVRARVARFTGGPADGVALLANATVGLNVVAELAGPDGEVLAPEGEFPSCTLPWIARGTPVRFVPVAPDGRFDVDDFERARTPGTRAVVLSAVNYATGFRADLGAIGAWCRRNDLAFIVDGTQAVGVVPVDVAASGIDALVFSGYKWATAGYGIAALVLAGRLAGRRPVLAGWRSQQEPYALRYDRMDPVAGAEGQEGGHPPFPNAFALGAALEGLEQVGVGRIHERVCTLVGRLHEVLDAHRIPMRSTRALDGRSGIVMTRFDEPVAVARALRERGVLASARGTGVRLSVHGYNDEGDIDALDRALVGLGG